MRDDVPYVKVKGWEGNGELEVLLSFLDMTAFSDVNAIFRDAVYQSTNDSSCR